MIEDGVIGQIVRTSCVTRVSTVSITFATRVRVLWGLKVVINVRSWIRRLNLVQGKSAAYYDAIIRRALIRADECLLSGDVLGGLDEIRLIGAAALAVLKGQYVERKDFSERLQFCEFVNILQKMNLRNDVEPITRMIGLLWGSMDCLYYYEVRCQ